MTKTLGNRKNASIALALVREFRKESIVVRYRIGSPEWMKRVPVKDRKQEWVQWDDFGKYPLPEGWTFLGMGWSRVALLGPDGFVYKVTKEQLPSDRRVSSSKECNRKESDNYRRLSEKARSAGFRLAACRMIYPSVLCMEYVEKNGLISVDVCFDIEHALGLIDLHDGNVWLDHNNVPTIIDYAE